MAAHGAVFCSDISTRLLSYVLMILLRFATKPDFADRDVCHDDTSYAVVLLKSLRLRPEVEGMESCHTYLHEGGRLVEGVESKGTRNRGRYRERLNSKSSLSWTPTFCPILSHTYPTLSCLNSLFKAMYCITHTLRCRRGEGVHSIISGVLLVGVGIQAKEVCLHAPGNVAQPRLRSTNRLGEIASVFHPTSDLDAARDDDLVPLRPHALDAPKAHDLASFLASALFRVSVATPGADPDAAHRLVALDDIAVVVETTTEDMGEIIPCIAMKRSGCLHCGVSRESVVANDGDALSRNLHPPPCSRPDSASSRRAGARCRGGEHSGGIRAASAAARLPTIRKAKTDPAASSSDAGSKGRVPSFGRRRQTYAERTDRGSARTLSTGYAQGGRHVLERGGGLRYMRGGNGRVVASVGRLGVPRNGMFRTRLDGGTLAQSDDDESAWTRWTCNEFACTMLAAREVEA